jgi:hypothetical protein
MLRNEGENTKPVKHLTSGCRLHPKSGHPASCSHVCATELSSRCHIMLQFQHTERRQVPSPCRRTHFL